MNLLEFAILGPLALGSLAAIGISVASTLRHQRTASPPISESLPPVQMHPAIKLSSAPTIPIPTHKPLDQRIWLCTHCHTIHSDATASLCLHRLHTIGELTVWKAIPPRNIEGRHSIFDTHLMYIDDPADVAQLEVVSRELPLNYFPAGVN